MSVHYGKRRKKRGAKQAAKHSLHQLRKRRHMVRLPNTSACSCFCIATKRNNECQAKSEWQPNKEFQPNNERQPINECQPNKEFSPKRERQPNEEFLPNKDVSENMGVNQMKNFSKKRVSAKI